MADLNKKDIKLIKSQRLDDTDQGGGQMIGGPSAEVVSGEVNALFPDISRLDRTYGRVSMRKAFVAVQTTGQQVYYGAHGVLTRNAEDPNVSVCFFSTEDWYDTRKDAQSRIESYLVKGPMYTAALWGPHFYGTRQLSMFTEQNWTAPAIGDVIVLVKNEGSASQESQYVRVTDVTEEIRVFNSGTSTYNKKILTVEIGNQLLYDFTGAEVSQAYNYTANTTKLYTTVAADASRYYGVTALREDATSGNLQVRVKSITVPLVPSAQSQTAITDAGIGQAITPMLQTDDSITSVVRSISFTIAANSKLYIGEGILPGSFSWSGGLSLVDDGAGNVINGSTVVGSITYATGIVIFTNVTGSTSGNGTVTYKPACAPTIVAETGAISISTNNRGFVYTYSCYPLPKPGSLKIDYYTGGKWYSLQDRGDGAIRGSDTSIGAGAVNFLTGSVSLTLGAMPDAGSSILFFWGTNAPFYNLNGETLTLKYSGVAANTAITRGTFSISWAGDTVAAVDDGNGNLTVGSKPAATWVSSGTIIGFIRYATGEFEFSPHISQVVPLSSTAFRFRYSYGDKFQESFNPIRNGDGTVSFFLTNTPIRSGTLKVEWHTIQQEKYAVDENNVITVSSGVSGIHHSSLSFDPTHVFQDDLAGGFKNEDPSEFGTYIASAVNYATGEVKFMPDRVGVMPIPVYSWKSSRLQDYNSSDINVGKAYLFDRIEYVEVASLWPTDGVIICDYCTIDGANMVDYTASIPKAYYIKSDSYLSLVPGSVSIITDSTKYILDISGKLFIDVSGTLGTGTEVGTIDYAQRKLVITSDSITGRTVLVKSASGTADIAPVQVMTFRTPGAPLTPGSLGISATTDDGVHVTGSSDFAGNITGALLKGSIDYDTGIGYLTFGSWETDTYTALPANQRPAWYRADLVDGTDIWVPATVRASTVSINCVIYSYLPLDSDLLGLDPVRLPLDGRVPIFRDGNIILIHHTQKQNLPNPATAGNTYTIGRTNVDMIELYDSTGLYYPEVDGAVVNYTVNLTNGSVTFGAGASFSGFVQPFYSINRIEDMVLASDVQITGHIAITNQLKHSYPKDETMVSSVLPFKDLQARAYNEFVQSTWTGVWSDDLIGTAPLARYNFVDYPITVRNNGCPKERWLFKFKTSTTFDIIGEHLGVLVENAPTTGWPSGLIQIVNSLTGEVYWQMSEAGLGVGWAAGNCIRFNTGAANFPVQFVRTTLQGPPTEPTDSYDFQIRGDSD